MRASIKWLKDYVEFNVTPDQLADLLTMAGVPVDTVEYLGQNIENIVTGKITEILPHPNADKLSVCKVDTGNEILTIVTGASNISTGDIVPIATIGAKLPNGVVIQASDLRGVLSNGMMCSAAELNIESKLLAPDAREGIYILSDNTPLGADIKEVLGLNDVVLEFELTANRADCFSMLGIAREIAVLTKSTVKKPMLNLHENSDTKASSLVNITIEDISLCTRFACRILQNVKIGPSPSWLQHRLQAAGMRPINNVVDVTNFVMLEMGQPMHAYDYNLISKHSIIVRKAFPGERLTTLDGVKRELQPSMLVIADAGQAVGLAGVMGGLATEVTAHTQTILLEAAAFNGASIRRTSRALGLRSEASGRFERGVDTVNIIRALDRAAKLLEDMGACTVCSGIVDSYPEVILPKQVTFTPDQINAYLGANVSKSQMTDILKRLEFDVSINEDKITVTVPTWRNDVSGPADISEEVARIYGYDNIPSSTPVGKTKGGGQSHQQDIIDLIKNTMSGMGFDEIMSYSFIHPSTFDKLNFSADSTLREAISLLNPITDDFPKLRTTLMSGILDTIVSNLSRKNDDMKIYEIGAVYLPKTLPLTELPVEPLMLCGALTGNRNKLAWNDSRETVDFYDAKGAVESLLGQLGITGCSVSGGFHPSLHPGKTAIFSNNDVQVAIVGEVHPSVLTSYGINRKVFLFEMNVEQLTELVKLIPRYKPLPKYPSVMRDLALVLPVSVSADEVQKAIVTSAGPLLKEINLFDIYTGKQVPEGYRSMAYTLNFQADDRTLTDKEIDDHCKDIVVYMERNFGAQLRN